MEKKVGVLCHVTSIPGHGLKSWKRFVDWLSVNDYQIWQMLPLSPPDKFQSPYSSYSAFAGWSELCTEEPDADLSDEEYWLEDWALYSAIKNEHNGLPWYEWPEKLKNRDESELEKWKSKLGLYIDEQKSFQNAWTQIRTYSNRLGIELFGDLPIFVAHDSADVWAHRELFQLDENGNPLYVSGVPPDYFDENGQRWGTVLYNWEAHKLENWNWWKQRVKRMLRLFDIVRIDHFRGFHSCWAIPPEEMNAINGHWQDGPGDEILVEILGCADSRSQIIAEDLGIIPQEVSDLRIRNGIMGMAVLHFGFDGNLENNPHYPPNIGQDKIAYVATHDNDTTIGWWEKVDGQVKDRVRELSISGEDANHTLIRLAKESEAPITIIPLQDILGLGTESRMNVPGKAEGNWKWKFAWENLN